MTLLWYAKLLREVGEFRKSVESTASSSLLAALDACRAKIEKFFNLSSEESIYYYSATGKRSFICRSISLTISLILVLDPRLKLSFFNPNPDLFPSEWLSDMHDCFIKEVDSRQPTSNSTTASTPASESFFDGLGLTELMEMDNSGPMAPKTTLEEYVSYKHERIDRNVSPLKYWKSAEMKYPRLARLARSVLAIPGKHMSQSGSPIKSNECLC
jgi:hypothetical protein